MDMPYLFLSSYLAGSDIKNIREYLKIFFICACIYLDIRRYFQIF
jgi:hypothetical protein